MAQLYLHLYANRTPLNHLSDLKSCLYLNRLDIAHTRVTDCSPLAKCPIDHLSIHGSPIKKLGDVAHRLTRLSLNKLEDLEDSEHISEECLLTFSDSQKSTPEDSIETNIEHEFFKGKLYQQNNKSIADLSNQIVKGLGSIANYSIHSLKLENCELQCLELLKALDKRYLTILNVASNPIQSVAFETFQFERVKHFKL